MDKKEDINKVFEPLHMLVVGLASLVYRLKYACVLMFVCTEPLVMSTDKHSELPFLDVALNTLTYATIEAHSHCNSPEHLDHLQKPWLCTA